MTKDQVMTVLKACTQICHLNLSFVKAVDDEVVDYLGSKFAQTLLSLELRACHNMTDTGIINLCEGLSGIKEMRSPEEKLDEYSRYKSFNRHDVSANL
eukprot:CAMPEP_0170547492 /NCGR_PEP_ID=MMETSP0211-20121228/5912_1 /TAXON_ID=311385 /ORGANISM="Pseudokeronopsis sp., Strain OXSARD2" /LENGTH=97 /DNA_ID=CAMNT_0010852587 /DNA_START=214 /DNA_END=507 /DNA_ORIENTATION=-